MTDEELYERNRELRSDELRQALLSQCDDEAQVDRVQRLVLAGQSKDSLLDTTAMQPLDEDVREPPPPQKTIGDFEIQGELGRGGMGVVYAARQKSLKRQVALKVLSSGLGLSSKAILRFRREAEAAGKLHHTNIVPIYTTGEDKGVHFYAMELIDGPSLDQVIKDMHTPAANDSQAVSSIGSRDSAVGSSTRDVRNPQKNLTQSTLISSGAGTRQFDQIATMIADVAEALDHAHEHGVVHRDIKPSNLLLGPDGRLSINDFGLARMLEQPGMTVSGEFVGSPLYMSPEQITAGRVKLDHRTDIYSLGATLYEMLTGQPPFPGQSRDQVLSQILHKEPASARKLNRKVPLDLDTICMKAIDKDPDRRYQTAGKLADDLRKYVNRYAISARRVGPVVRTFRYFKRNPLAAAFALTIVLCCATAFYFWRDAKERDRIAEVNNLQTELIEDLFRGDTRQAPRILRDATRKQASDEQLAFMSGLVALFDQDYENAIVLLNEASSHKRFAVASSALRAFAKLWSGDEYEYFKVMSTIDYSAANSFEDYFFVGFATSWEDPALSKRLLLEAEDFENGHPYVRFLVGVASCNLATMDIYNPAEALVELRLGIEKISHSGVPRSARFLRELACGYLCLSRLATEVAESNLQDENLLLEEAAEALRNATLLIPELESLASNDDAQYGLVNLLIQLNHSVSLRKLSDEWLANEEEDVMIYAAQFIALDLIARGEIEQAQRWLPRLKGTTAQKSRFVDGVISLLAGAEWNHIHDQHATYVNKKIGSGDTEYLGHDLTLLYLLGTNKLKQYKQSRLAKLIRGGELYRGHIAYFSSDRTHADRMKLLDRCKTGPAPIPALMHAHYFLGMIDLAEGQLDKARYHLTEAKNGRQQLFWVARLSSAILAHEDQWDTWLEKRKALIASDASQIPLLE